MRPHVELIHEDDYIWHGAELPGGEGRASERRLSVDEEDGSCSLRVDFHTDWGRGAGIHHADTECYVRRGRDRLRRPDDRQGRLRLRAPRACRWTTSRSPRAPDPALPRVRRRRLRPGRPRRRRTLGRRPRGRHRHRHRGDDVGRGAQLAARCPASTSSSSTSTRRPASTRAWCTRRTAGRTTGWRTTRATRRPTRSRATWSTTSARSTSAPTSSGRPGSSTATSRPRGRREWLLRSDGELINWYTPKSG